jgi:membrane fusion protein, multidrug efflux system
MILVVAIAFGASCGRGKQAPKPPREVQAATAIKGDIARSVLFTGDIEGRDAVKVFPRAPGKVSRKMLKEGDLVKRGQAILTIDRDEIGYAYKPMILDAPIDGKVGAILVDVGDNVTPQTAAAVVFEPGVMRVKLNVPERYLPSIVLGETVTMEVDSLGAEKFPGTISSISPYLDEKSRTAKVEVEVPNLEGKLRHGMFGRLQIPVERREGAIALPADAISWEGERRFVYKIIEGKLARAEVKTGIRADHSVEILEGVAENDRVVVGDLLTLRDGEKVTVLEEPKE